MEQEVKEKITAAADDLFMRLGIRSVTMDDVAGELAMSKKTLYLYFDNKDNLVTAVAERHLRMEKEEFCLIAEHAENAIDELHRIAKCLRDHISKMNPSTLYDIQKYHSTAWNHYLSFKNSFIRGNVEKNIKRGKQEGYFREDLDEAILARFRVEQVQMIFDQKIFPPDQFSFADVQLQLFDHFVHGLLTESGKELYQNFQKEEAKSLLT